MQKEGLNNILYKSLEDYIPKAVLTNKNRKKSWEYGYNEKYDFICISKSGEVGDILNIQGLIIGLPKTPKKIYSRSKSKPMQYWERVDIPKQLRSIQSIFQWNEMPNEFKNNWVDYIENEFDCRELGYWFYNNGVPTYITGAHYMYLQWTSIDVGYPDYREANRIFYILGSM